ncbi:type II secretion system minor pseudopilin GspJ [Thalassotalea agariperforans]
MQHNRGFTLLELLLAMAIFAVISLAGFTIFNTVFESEKGSRAKIAKLNKLQTAFILLERDITQIARRHVRMAGDENSNNFIHSQNGGFSSNADGIAFIRSGWTNPGLILPRSDLQAVAYRLNDKILERVYYNFVDPVQGEEPKVRPLLAGVTDLVFEFFYENKWQQELISGKMPLGLAVEITTEDFGKIRRQFLVAGDDTGSAQGG